MNDDAEKGSESTESDASSSPLDYVEPATETDKVRAVFRVSPGLLLEVQDAVAALAGAPTYLTMSSLAETALRSELDRLKLMHNAGRPFPRPDVGSSGSEVSGDSAEWIEGFREDPNRRRLREDWQMGRPGPEAREAIPTLIEALANENSGVRFWAVRGLAAIGADATSAVPSLASLLRDPIASVRSRSALALGRMIQAPGPAVAALAEALGTDDDPVVRECAAEALGMLGSNAGEAVEALIKALSDSTQSVRFRAATALGKVGEAAAGALTALMAAVSDEDWSVRSSAVWAIGQLGPKSQAATATLEAALNDENPMVSERAAESLEQIKRMS